MEQMKKQLFRILESCTYLVVMAVQHCSVQHHVNRRSVCVCAHASVCMRDRRMHTMYVKKK